MKVILISDTHGLVTDAILGLIREADLCVHAGDLGGGAVMHQIRATGISVLAVRGNNDVPAKWLPDDHSLLQNLPLDRVIDLPGGQLYVEHGHRIGPPSARHQKLRNKYPEVKAIVYGHSHRAVKDLQSTPWVLNPGAAGRIRTFGGASCMVLKIATNQRWNVKIFKPEPG